MLVVGFAFCFIIGLIPCWIQKGKMNSFLFWGINNLLVTAVLKIWIGEMNLTLIESFDDIGIHTLIHYAGPFLVLDLVGVILGRLLFKSRFSSFQEAYLSGFSLCFISCYVLFFRVENVMLVVSAILAFLGALALVIVGDSYRSGYSYKQKVSIISSAFLVYFVTTIVFIPTEFVVYNYKDLEVTLVDLAVSQILFGILLIILLLLAMNFMYDIHLHILLAFFLLVGIGGYIQGNFLNGRLEILDGRKPQEWTLGCSIVNILVWGCILFILLFIRKHREKWLTYLCVYLCAVQVLSMGYIVLTVERPEKKGNYELTSEAILDVGNENNILVFVLDWFDEQILEKILNESPEFLAPLHDFTWYPNCTSKYAFTDMSIPYLLTGTDWELGMNEVEYSEYAHENGKLLQAIHESGYKIGIYTETINACNLPEKWVDNASTNVDAAKNRMKVCSLLHKSTMYKIAPFSLKRIYRYNCNEFALSISTASHNNLYRVSGDGQIEINNLLATEGIRVLDTPNSFKFIHILGVHPGFCFNENMEYSDEATDVSQGKAALNLVYNFIIQLKENDLFDNATIIITADHGQNYLNSEKDMEEYGYEPTSNPIMFVKMPNQLSNKLTISMAPVSHEQIAPTIMNALKIQSDEKSFQEIQENEKIEREFIYVRHPDIPYTRYLINGNVRNIDCWKIDN